MDITITSLSSCNNAYDITTTLLKLNNTNNIYFGPDSAYICKNNTKVTIYGGIIGTLYLDIDFYSSRLVSGGWSRRSGKLFSTEDENSCYTF